MEFYNHYNANWFQYDVMHEIALLGDIISSSRKF